MKTAAIIMAAGQSTRINSDLPKVLHEVCGRPMLFHGLQACRDAGAARILVVVGHGHETVRAAFAGEPDLVWIHQKERKGTGHAVMCCETALADVVADAVLVIAGDMPLVRAATLEALIAAHRASRPSLTLATATLPDPTGYGRIIRDSDGKLVRIVEQPDCTPEQRAILEVNPSYYCFERRALFDALKKITPNPIKGEYYLTDVVHELVKSGQTVTAIPSVAPEEATGVNSRQELAHVNRLMQQRIQKQWMLAGVTLVDPHSTWINHGATIGRDTIVYPFSFIDGGVVVGASCRIGPFACLMAGDQLGDGEALGGKQAPAAKAQGSGTGRSGPPLNVPRAPVPLREIER